MGTPKSGTPPSSSPSFGASTHPSDAVRWNQRALSPLRLLLLLAAFCALTGFDACDDDPLLDSGGGTGCAGSHCSARTLPDEDNNPSRF